MKQAPFKFLVLAALLALPGTALAQGKNDNPPKKGTPAKAEVEDLGGDETPPPASNPGKSSDTSSPSSPTSSSGDSVICESIPEACQVKKLVDDYAPKELKDSQVYAVQQIYALKRNRVELMPYWGASLNDQFVSHSGVGLAINYYVTNVLAIGINGNYYGAFNSEAEFNRLVRQSTRLSIPVTEYQWGANLNFTYVPLSGKFAGFGDFIFHWDAYVLGGVGVISTRPKAVIDPVNRNFDFKPKVAFNLGMGFRVFFNRWFAMFGEVRDYIYSEDIESTAIAADVSNTNSWYGPSRLTNAVQAQFGLSIFMPFSWHYRLPK